MVRVDRNSAARLPSDPFVGSHLVVLALQDALFWLRHAELVLSHTDDIDLDQ